PQHISTSRAERHPNSDLVCAPRNRVRHNTEQPDAREQKREHSEETRKLRNQFLLNKRAANVFGHGHHIHNRKLAVDFLYGPANLGRNSSRISRKTYFKVTEVIDGLCVRIVGHRLWLFHQVPILGILDHTDYFYVFAVFGTALPKALPDCRSSRKKLASHRFADHRNLWRGLCVLRTELPAFQQPQSHCVEEVRADAVVSG